jgi:hypothetical protein
MTAMKRLVSLVGIVCGLAADSAAATTVTTELFTIEIPGGWGIENDEAGVIVAYGERIVDRAPVPFLSIQYCTNSTAHSATSKQSHMSACTGRCVAEAFSSFKEQKGTIAPVERRVTPDGIVELRTRVAEPPSFASIGFSCSALGQVYVALASDESADQVEKTFGAVFSSIAWKQDIPPAPELIAESRRLTVREPLPFVRTQWGDGVIFPPAFGDSLVAGCSRESLGLGDAYWRPTEGDVQQAERIVAEYMSEHGLDSPEVHTWPGQPGPKTWPDLKDYQRQYIGVIRGSQKTIYATFVPARSALADEYWRRRPFNMCDGGPDHFGVETNLTSSAVLHIAFDSCMCRFAPSQ